MKPLPARYSVPILTILILLLLTRLLFLGDKPYHHDESLHAIEAWRYATKGTYKFNPMLHGPLLYHFQAGIFSVFPINEWTGRLSTALTGIFMPIVGFLFLRKINLLSAVVFLALVTFSPVNMFFSRTVIMDSLVMFLAVVVLSCSVWFWQKKSVRYLYMATLAFALMVCTKLNFLFYGFSFVTFGVFYLLWKRWIDDANFSDQLNPAFAFIKKFWWHWICAFVLLSFVFCAFYSSFGSNWPGILDGLYRKMIPYWVKQNAEQRIKGPFGYYFPILATYELPILISIGWVLWHAVRSSALFSKRSLLWIGGSFLIYGLAAWGWAFISGFMAQRFHLDYSYHILILLLELGAWLTLLTYHFKREEFLPAFCAHWGIVSLILYSYAGEKVPWLSTHILLPWLFYVALVVPGMLLRFMSQPLERVMLGTALILVLGWQGMISIRASFAMAANPRERLVYTHTSYQMLDLVGRINHLSKVTGSGNDLKIQVIGMAAWPLYWYLRDYKKWFRHNFALEEKPLVMVMDWDSHSSILARVNDEYVVERFKLREWWVPDNTKRTFEKLIRYYFTREVYSGLGSSDLAVFIQRDQLLRWDAP